MYKKSTKSARARKPYPVAKKHHLDKRADAIAAVDSDADDDELLTTREVANWFRVSGNGWRSAVPNTTAPSSCASARISFDTFAVSAATI